MNEEISHPAETARERVILFFALLTSEEDCFAHRELPPDRLAYERCRLWFDEIYTPSAQYLDGIKGDRSKEAVARFQAGFTDGELEALERFHRFLELRIDMLPDDAHRRQAFPQGDAWDAVVRHGGYVLEELISEPDRLRQQLAELARQREQTDDSPEDRLFAVFHEALHRNRLTD